MSVTLISDAALVKRAVANARARRVAIETPRWVAIHDTFALGSTYSAELCRIHGLDPDEMIHGTHCERCEQEDEE